MSIYYKKSIVEARIDMETLATKNSLSTYDLITASTLQPPGAIDVLAVSHHLEEVIRSEFVMNGTKARDH